MDCARCEKNNTCKSWLEVWNNFSPFPSVICSSCRSALTTAHFRFKSKYCPLCKIIEIKEDHEYCYDCNTYRLKYIYLIIKLRIDPKNTESLNEFFNLRQDYSNWIFERMDYIETTSIRIDNQKQL